MRDELLRFDERHWKKEIGKKKSGEWRIVEEKKKKGRNDTPSPVIPSNDGISNKRFVNDFRIEIPVCLLARSMTCTGMTKGNFGLTKGV